MSIRDEINARIEEGRLFCLKPLNSKDQKRRTVLMSQEINAIVCGPWPDGPMGARCARLRGDLENFITAEFITVCLKPFKARDEQIGRLDADEVWDLRSQEPKPGLRILFRFAEKDVLVAFTCLPRSVPVPWLLRLPLLGQESREWRNAILECKREWNLLFPAYQPLKGSTVDDYLTGGTILQ
jgi:hypothetical protein